MQQPIIFKPDPAAEFFTDEGCFILENANSPLDPDCSVARARVRPGVTTRWHFLEGTAERYLILSGMGKVEIGDLPPTLVEPGDVVIIPPGAPQRIENVGVEDLVFYCICTPRFLVERYFEVENPIS